MIPEEFESLVGEALAGLPAQIRGKLDNVAVTIEQSPSSEQLKKGGTTAGSILLGLYEGVPQTKRGAGYNLVLPDKISIFQQSIETVAQRDPGQIRELVKNTVWHEIAHHFGLDESGVRRLEQQRRQRSIRK